MTIKEKKKVLAEEFGLSLLYLEVASDDIIDYHYKWRIDHRDNGGPIMPDKSIDLTKSRVINSKGNIRIFYRDELIWDFGYSKESLEPLDWTEVSEIWHKLNNLPMPERDANALKNYRRRQARKAKKELQAKGIPDKIPEDKIVRFVIPQFKS